MPRAPLTPARRAALRSQGAAIADGRRRAGLSQPAAAALLGVPLDTLRKWEHGRRTCPAATRLKLAKLWSIPRELVALDPREFACPCCGRPY